MARWPALVLLMEILRIPAVMIGIGMVLFANGAAMLDTAAIKHMVMVVLLAPVVALGLKRIAGNPARKRGTFGFIVTAVCVSLSVVGVCMALTNSPLPALLSLVGAGVAIFGIHTGMTSGSFTSAPPYPASWQGY